MVIITMKFRICKIERGELTLNFYRKFAILKRTKARAFLRADEK